MEEKQTGMAPSKTSYEAYGLYDRVRLDIWVEFVETSRYLERINKKEFYSKVPDTDPDVLILKTKVAGTLGLLILDKVDYPMYSKNFQNLKQLEAYVNGRRSITQMSLTEAKQYLRLIRGLIEALGISKFEKEKFDPTNLPAELIGV